MIQIKTAHHTFLCYSLFDHPPQGIGISPIFNVADMKLYKGDNNNIYSCDSSKANWIKGSSTEQTIKCILDTKIVKKNKSKTYKEYLVKWQGLTEVEAT